MLLTVVVMVSDSEHHYKVCIQVISKKRISTQAQQLLSIEDKDEVRLHRRSPVSATRASGVVDRSIVLRAHVSDTVCRYWNKRSFGPPP